MAMAVHEPVVANAGTGLPPASLGKLPRRCTPCWIPAGSVLVMRPPPPSRTLPDGQLAVTLRLSPSPLTGPGSVDATIRVAGRPAAQMA
jgi:hypothetical protein